MVFGHMVSSYLLCISNCSVLTVMVKETVFSLSAVTGQSLRKAIIKAKCMRYH